MRMDAPAVEEARLRDNLERIIGEAFRKATLRQSNIAIGFLGWFAVAPRLGWSLMAFRMQYKMYECEW